MSLSKIIYEYACVLVMDKSQNQTLVPAIVKFLLYCRWNMNGILWVQTKVFGNQVKLA